MKFLVLPILCLALIACQSTSSDTAEDTSDTTEPSEVIVTESETFDNILKKETDSYTQTLYFNQVDDTTLTFKVIFNNIQDDCILTVKGTAINHYAQFDGEMDEDEEGNGYPSDEYTFENDEVGYLAIRIDAESGDKAKILHTLNEEPGLSCQVFMEDIMRK